MEIKNNIPIVKEEAKRIRREVRKQTAGYILAALGLVAGLAWNEAIKGLIDYFFPSSQGGILIKFAYAVLITIFVVVAATYISRIFTKDEGRGE